MGGAVDFLPPKLAKVDQSSSCDRRKLDVQAAITGYF